MAEKTKKNEGISCGCSRPDLNKIWLENEKKKKEVSEESTSSKAKDCESNAEATDEKELG